jgi:hypothetical protein
VYLRRFLGSARSCKAEGIISLFLFNRYARYEELFGLNFGMQIIAKQTAEFMEILLFSLIELVLFIFLALKPIVVVFYSPVAGFSLLVFEVS